MSDSVSTPRIANDPSTKVYGNPPGSVLNTRPQEMALTSESPCQLQHRTMHFVHIQILGVVGDSNLL